MGMQKAILAYPEHIPQAHEMPVCLWMRFFLKQLGTPAEELVVQFLEWPVI